MPSFLESATAAFVSYLPYGSPDLFTPYANIAGAIVLNSDPASPLLRAMVHTEIITHELTHAIAHFWFGGFGSGLELRALSESFADLLGVIGNGWIRNEPVDWTVGDAWRKPDAQGNAVIRRLYDPLNYQSQGLNHRL